jgi:dihydroflavonol-4-reductase
LIHISTVNTLGIGLLSNPADEESGLPGLVNCPYVSSKLRAEQALQKLVVRGLEATIVHPGFCLGPWDWKPSSGRMLLAVNRGAFVAPSGAFNVVDVRDVSAGIIEATKFAGQSRRYILGGHNLSYLDGWRMFARAGGGHGPHFRMGPIARWLGSWGSDAWARFTGEEGGVNSAAIGISSQHSCFTSRRAERELNYRIRPLEQTVADAWNWFRERGYVSRQHSSVRPAVQRLHS